MQILQKWKTIFIKKDLHHNFVQCFGTGASHDLAHNISKN
jgi:hypothetical protein